MMILRTLIWVCLLAGGVIYWQTAAAQTPTPQSYSASIKSGQIDNQNAMRVEGVFRDIFDTKNWNLEIGYIWRIYIGTPIKFIWNDHSRNPQRVVLNIDEMSLSRGDTRSAMVIKVNGKPAVQFDEAPSFKRTSLDITRDVVLGENTLEVSSKDGTNLLHGIQSVEVVYYPAAVAKTPPQLVITEPSLDRGLRVNRPEKAVTIRGKASAEGGIYEVLVNDVEASISANGTFQAEVLLGVGENTIRVKATDTRRNSSEIKFTIVREPDTSVAVSAKAGPAPGLALGQYYALIIAVQKYQDPEINSLDYPLQDAKRIKELISREYIFDGKNLIFLENPDRATIINTLDDLAQRLTEADNLLIFYAGHGYWDESLKQGFWLPSNVRRSSRSEWLSNSTVRDYLGGIKAKHILLIADACFSGSIFKTREAFAGAPVSIQELYKLPSRKAMTSGTLKSVPDKSVFVEYLVKRLSENHEKFLSAEQLFSSLRVAVINNSPNGQTPQYGEIRESGDEGGDFIFVRR